MVVQRVRISEELKGGKGSHSVRSAELGIGEHLALDNIIQAQDQLVPQVILLLWQVPGYDEECLQLLLLVPAVFLRGAHRSQGYKLLALVAVFMTILAGYVGV